MATGRWLRVNDKITIYRSLSNLIALGSVATRYPYTLPHWTKLGPSNSEGVPYERPRQRRAEGEEELQEEEEEALQKEEEEAR